MLDEALSYFLYLYSLLLQAIVPCSVPELLPANSVDRHQYLGKWYFIAAVSQREADIQQFNAVDSILFILEETANDTLLLTGHVRMGDSCMKRTWTYHLHPERDGLELEGMPERKNLIWNGKFANCASCIIMQEIDPPLNKTDTEDSLNRYLLYVDAGGDIKSCTQARQPVVDSEVVATFLKNSACHKRLATLRLPQEKEICTQI